MHDFIGRPYYHVVLRYYDILAIVKTLVVLRPKPGALIHPPSGDVIRRLSPTRFVKARHVLADGGSSPQRRYNAMARNTSALRIGH